MTFLKPLGNNIWLNLTMLASKIPPFCKFDIIDNHLTSSFDPIELVLFSLPFIFTNAPSLVNTHTHTHTHTHTTGRDRGREGERV